jgi:hypothetical protein
MPSSPPSIAALMEVLCGALRQHSVTTKDRSHLYGAFATLQRASGTLICKGANFQDARGSSSNSREGNNGEEKGR